MKPADRHWTDEDILEHVYGIGSMAEEHLPSCGVCRQRVHAVESNLKLVRTGPEPLDTPFFAAQRRRIYERIDQRRTRTMHWRIGSALLAAAAMLVITLNLAQVGTSPIERREVAPASSDAELYKEISTLVAQDEPRVGEPMRALFKESNH